MVAQALSLSRAEVHGVFTFYHDFRKQPAGRHVLKLCRAEACQAAGGDALAARAEAKLGISLGNTTADERVTLERSTASASAPPRLQRCWMARGRPARRCAHRCAGRGGTAMTMRIFVPRDAGAVAVGADDIALAFGQSAAQRGVTIEIVRTGSRGLYWLEPLVELATAHGRIAFGPVTTSDVPSLLDAMAGNGQHALRLGVTDEIPWLKRQTRLTFRALRRGRSALGRRLSRPWRLQGPGAGADADA